MATTETEPLFLAEKKYAQKASKAFHDLKLEVEKKEWVAARLAWIGLERLRGRESEALLVFKGCESYCEKYGDKKEWLTVKSWAEKAKAQKPAF